MEVLSSTLGTVTVEVMLDGMLRKREIREVEHGEYSKANRQFAGNGVQIVTIMTSSGGEYSFVREDIKILSWEPVESDSGER